MYNASITTCLCEGGPRRLFVAGIVRFSGGVGFQARWWAHLVGALRVHPHKHYASDPPQKDRGPTYFGRIYLLRVHAAPRARAVRAMPRMTKEMPFGALGHA